MFALVDRDGDMVAMKVPSVNSENIKSVIRKRVSKDAKIMTDKYTMYQVLDEEFAFRYNRRELTDGERTVVF